MLTKWFGLVVQEDLGWMQSLLEVGANPNGDWSLIPLHSAVHSAVLRGNRRSVRFLLDHGANVNKQDSEGRTALHFARVPEIAEILLKTGANIHVRDRDGMTPFLFGVSRGFPSEVLRAFVAAGADPTAIDKEGRTAGQLVFELSTPRDWQRLTQVVSEARRDWASASWGVCLFP